MLRNLDDKSITALTNFMQECWEKGEIPQQWKTAKVIFIPKPGKPLNLENLRPISLTSCVGKLMEHVIQTRLTNFMEDNDLYPHSMIGFRSHLSTQDVMIQLTHDILDTKSLDAKVIVGLDLTKAFDNVKHEAILENLALLNVGERTYNYIANFLSDRIARIHFGESQSQDIHLGSIGTPQGSVLSPILFNVAMIRLPKRLEGIDGLNFCMYADDITMWMTRGHDAHIESTLQKAINEVENYVSRRGLQCSPQKSELLFYRPLHQRQTRTIPNIKLQTQGAEIPHVEKIRILGMIIQSNGYNGDAITKMENCAQQTMRLIQRIANRRHGMKEQNLLRLVQAFVVSRISYAAPFLDLKVSEKEKINGIIRRCTKQALGLPIRTSTHRLLELGMHNTLEEITEAVRTSQIERLAGTTTGRAILEKLNLSRDNRTTAKVDMLGKIRDNIVVPPLPRNMHPIHHSVRRAKRAEALEKRFRSYKDEDVVYVDAAEYGKNTMTVAVAIINNSSK